jgi:hypothetical protein
MSINGKTVSLKTIVERVYTDFGFNYSLNWNDAAEWAGSLLALLKAPNGLEDKFAVIDIDEMKGGLPCDLESIVSVAFIAGSNCSNKKSAFVFQDKGSYLADVVELDKVNREAVIALSYKNSNELWCQFTNLIPMRYTTDTFYRQTYHCTNWDFDNSQSTYTYKVNNNYIFTNFRNGKVLMAYRAIPTDEEGFPLIPAEEKWRRAVTYEIAYKIAFKLWIHRNIEDRVFQIIERERDWAASHAGKHEFTLDGYVSLKNSMTKLIPEHSAENHFFRNLQLPEERYNHPLRMSR